jgi:tetratricopeptide (TPR) repeat protein
LVGILMIVGFGIAAWRMAGPDDEALRRVEEALRACRWDEADDLVRSWLEREPNSAEVHYARARMAFARQQPEETIEALDRADVLGFDRDRLAILRAALHARMGLGTDAEPILRAALQDTARPQPEVAEGLTRLCLDRFQLSRALVYIDRWRRDAPCDARTYLFENEVVQRSDADPSVMIQNYRAALERDPGLDAARLGLAQQLQRAKRLDEAAPAYEDYLKSHPDSVEGLIGAGRNDLDLMQLDRAAARLDRAAELAPRDVEALLWRSVVDLRRNRPEDAEARLARAAGIDPHDSEVRYQWSVALQRMGQTEDARAQTREHVRLRNEHARMEDIRRALMNTPNDLNLSYLAAKWMLDHDRREEGLRWAEKVLAVDPHHRPTHQLLAEYHRRQGDSGSARYHEFRAGPQP